MKLQKWQKSVLILIGMWSISILIVFLGLPLLAYQRLYKVLRNSKGSPGSPHSSEYRARSARSLPGKM